MHTLAFASYTAILDPVTGLGVLMLPDQVVEEQLIVYDERLGTTHEDAFFRLDADEYLTIMRKLGSIGWVLPENASGEPTWWDAGPTDCCGRSMISLNGLDPTDGDKGLYRVGQASHEIQRLAVEACCGPEAQARQPATMVTAAD